MSYTQPAQHTGKHRPPLGDKEYCSLLRDETLFPSGGHWSALNSAAHRGNTATCWGKEYCNLLHIEATTLPIGGRQVVLQPALHKETPALTGMGTIGVIGLQPAGGEHTATGCHGCGM